MKKKTNQNSEQYISIPFSIMMDDRLSQTQKIIFGFVNGFDVGNNICYASNSYIGSVIGINETNASRAISKLIKLKLIYASNGKGRMRTLTTLSLKASNLVVKDNLPCSLRQPTLSLTTNNNIVNNINKNIVNKDQTKAVPADDAPIINQATKTPLPAYERVEGLNGAYTGMHGVWIDYDDDDDDP